MIEEGLLDLARAITSQANLNMVSRVNATESIMSSQLRDSVRLNPAIFLGYKVNEDPHEFVNRVYKVFSASGVTSMEKEEVVIAMASLHVPLVVRSISVSVYWVTLVALDVENMGTR